MFGIGTTELIIILALALIILGPARLPEVARTLGKGLASLRRTADEVKREINLEGIKADILQETGLDDLKKSVDVRGEIEKALTPFSEDDLDELDGGADGMDDFPELNESELDAEVTDSRKAVAEDEPALEEGQAAEKPPEPSEKSE